MTDLNAIEARHVQHVHHAGCHRHLQSGVLIDSAGLADYCVRCGEDWPCDTALAIVTLREAEARLDDYLGHALDALEAGT